MYFNELQVGMAVDLAPAKIEKQKINKIEGYEIKERE